MDIKYYLWLLLVLGPHNPKSVQLLGLYGDAQNIHESFCDEGIPLFTEQERNRAKKTPLAKAESIITACDNENVHIISIHSEQYPPLLKVIFNPPIVLFVKGNLSVLQNELLITIIGSRNAHAYSVKACERISGELASVGMTIVSGFAVGLDITAHLAAMAKGGETIAVLACGIFNKYPFQNYEYRQQIIDTGGAIISELQPYAETSGSYFKERNRILSGLSLGTLIIQASKQSGCLLTAEHTIQQGRDLFCLPPHDIFDGAYGGVVKYLRDGAIPVFSHLDVIYEYFEGFSYKFSLDQSKGDFMKKTESQVFAEESSSKRATKTAIKEDENPQKLEIPWETLDDESTAIIRLLHKGELSADYISEKTGIDHGEIFTKMMDLELEGLTESVPGGLFALNKNYRPEGE